jgi:hypothetical protein
MRLKWRCSWPLYNFAVLGQTVERTGAAGSKDETLLNALTMINRAATQYYGWLKQTPQNHRQLGKRKEGQTFADRDAADLIPLLPLKWNCWRLQIHFGVLKKWLDHNCNSDHLR